MNSNTLVDLLEERIKELSCLYDVASLSSVREKPFEEILQSIVNRIPLAWRFPEDAICELKTERLHLVSMEILAETVSQSEQIFIEERKIGYIAIHYPSPARNEDHFLKEEKSLLKKLSEEIASIIDRKESREREKTFIENHQRQDRLNILGEITAGIAHELNTPLGNILGFAQLILDSERDPQTLADSQKIMNSAIHAREVVKKLMFFACELPQRYEFVSINDLVEEALRLLTPSFLKSGIKTSFRKDEQNSQIQLDNVQITQVIFNLLINAIHASESNSLISVGIHADETCIHIDISDEGKGIPAAFQDKIFEPFYTTKPIGEGSGLGLSVVHGIIKAHRGSIQVESEPGKGTTFRIKLPLKQGL